VSIHFACPVCKTSYTVNDRNAGKKSECKRCGQRLQVPASRTMQTILEEELPPPEAAIPASGLSTLPLLADIYNPPRPAEQQSAAQLDQPSPMIERTSESENPRPYQLVFMAGLLMLAAIAVVSALPHIARHLASADVEQKAALSIRLLMVMGWGGVATLPCVTLAVVLVLGRRTAGPVWMVCIAAHLFSFVFLCFLSPMFKWLTIDLG